MFCYMLIQINSVLFKLIKSVYILYIDKVFYKINNFDFKILHFNYNLHFNNKCPKSSQAAGLKALMFFVPSLDFLLQI